MSGTGGTGNRRSLKSLVNIGSVIELPDNVNLNPNKSYEKFKMKKRVQCIRYVWWYECWLLVLYC